MNESPDSSSPSVYIAGGCLLACLIGLFLPSTPSSPVSGTQPPRVRATPAPPSASTPADSAGENRVTFAQIMPRAQGAQVFNNTGRPNLAMVMVAIPDGPTSVRFVRGNDPATIRYLHETELQQKRTLYDEGPQEIDTSGIANLGPLRARSTRRARNLAAGNLATTPSPDPQESPLPQ